MRRLAACLLAASLLVCLPGGAHAARSKVESKPMVGECHDLALAQLAPVSDESRPVPCSQRHTTLVVAVPTLPARVPLDGSTTYFNAADKACTKSWAQATTKGDYLKLIRTAYSDAFFAPTKAQQRAGAHWVRCDVVLLGGDHLVPLTGKPPFAAGALTDAIAHCDTKTYHVTTCSQPHSFRMVHVFKLSMRHGPTTQQAQRIAARRCPPYVGTGAYAYSVASMGSYAAGDHAFACLKHDPT